MLKAGVLTPGLVFFLLCCSAPLMLSLLISVYVYWGAGMRWGGGDSAQRMIRNPRKAFGLTAISISKIQNLFNSINTFQYHHLTCQFSHVIYFRPSSLKPNLLFQVFWGHPHLSM